MKPSVLLGLAAVVAMLATPAIAQSRYEPWYTPDDSYESFNRSLQDSRNSESVQDRLNRQRSFLRRRQEQERLQNEIRDLEHENRRLRALRAQEHNAREMKRNWPDSPNLYKPRLYKPPTYR